MSTSDRLDRLSAAEAALSNAEALWDADIEGDQEEAPYRCILAEDARNKALRAFDDTDILNLEIAVRKAYDTLLNTYTTAAFLEYSRIKTLFNQIRDNHLLAKIQAEVRLKGLTPRDTVLGCLELLKN